MHFYLTEVKIDKRPWHADHHITATVLVVTGELSETAHWEDSSCNIYRPLLHGLLDCLDQS